MNTKKKPRFRRTQCALYKGLSRKGWRWPSGKHNKIRERKKGKGAVPTIGYGAERGLRYLHPSGLEDILVLTLGDIERIDPKRQAARISARIGKREKALLFEELKKRNVLVLNPVKVR